MHTFEVSAAIIQVKWQQSFSGVTVHLSATARHNQTWTAWQCLSMLGAKVCFSLPHILSCIVQSNQHLMPLSSASHVHWTHLLDNRMYRTQCCYAEHLLPTLCHLPQASHPVAGPSEMRTLFISIRSAVAIWQDSGCPWHSTD